MASLRVHPDRLEIHLTPAEKTLAFRREGLVIQRTNIRSVTITDDPWIWVRGIRAPGALVPLVLAVGVWKFHGGKDFLAIKRKRQAVVIDLIGDEFARVILSTNHAPDLIASLKLEHTEAADVPELNEAAAAEETLTPAGDDSQVKPARRTRAAKPAKPAKPAEQVEPVEFTEPAEPVAPAKRTRTAKPAKPLDSAGAAEPSAAAKPARRARTPKAAPPVEAAPPAEAAPAAEAAPPAEGEQASA